MRLNLVVFIWLIVGCAKGQPGQPKAPGAVSIQTVTYADTLKMDIYSSQTTVSANQAVVMYVHGGGFSGGKRDEAWLKDFFSDLAVRGYVVASVSYHLTMRGQSFSCDQEVAKKINTLKVAAQNVNQATAYLLANREKFGISSKIVVSGSSAGAEAVLHAAYWKETQTGILQVDFRYAGVISMAGALLDENWITSDSAIPTQLFHGPCDNLVPYGQAPHHYCQPGDPGFMMLSGSRAIAKRLESLGKGYFLFTACGGAHEWAGKPINEQREVIIDFLSLDVMKGAQRQIKWWSPEQDGSCNLEYAACN